MSTDVSFTYENANGKITFAQFPRLFYISNITGVSNIDITISGSQSPGQIGTTIAGQSIKARNITVTGCFFEPMDINRDKILRIISPQIPATFTATINGESWYLDVVPSSTPEINFGSVVGDFQFKLYAAYPYWRSIEIATYQLGGVRKLFRFPRNFSGTWKISEFTASEGKVVTNDGNVPMGFEGVMYARMAVVDPELIHINTGDKIKFTKGDGFVLNPGDRIYFSTVYGKQGAQLVDANGLTSNAFRYIDIKSNLNMKIEPGENMFKYDAVVNVGGLDVLILAHAGERSGV